MLQNYIMGSYYGIISRNPVYEKDPGDARDVPGGPWNPRDPLGTLLGPPGTPLEPPGMPLGPPGDVPETHGDAPGITGSLQGHIWITKTPTNRQIYSGRSSIAVFKSACWDPAHDALDLAVVSMAAKIKNGGGGPGHGEKGGCLHAPMGCSRLYIR